MNYRRTWTVGLFLLMATLVSAQYNTMHQLYLGVSGGASASTILLVPKTVDKFYSLGKTGGVTLRYISEEHFGIQLECNYLESGWKEDYYATKNWSQYTYSRKLTSIDVPILAHLYTQTGSTRFFINAGPDFSYVLSETSENRSPVVMIQHNKKVETKFQYGLLGGGGIDFKIGKTLVGLEGRYSYYLSNIFKDAIGEDFYNSNLQIVSLRLNILYQLK